MCSGTKLPVTFIVRELDESVTVPVSIFAGTYRDDCSVLVIRIGMPEPEHDHLSRAVYLCYCDKNGENLYFMSELAADGRYFLCCRPDSERIRHMLCKDAPEDDSTEFDMVADLYGELVIEDGLKQLESVCAC